jgi:hypothetical protein
MEWMNYDHSIINIDGRRCNLIKLAEMWIKEALSFLRIKI